MVTGAVLSGEMSSQIYGIPAVLAIFAEHGAKMSRQMFNQSILPKWVATGFAERHGRSWAFDLRYTQHWAEYIAASRKRKAEGTLPGNYEFSEFDMQCFIGGLWDD